MSQSIVSADNAVLWVKKILMHYEVSDVDASTIAQCLVSADLRGHESHGINRIPSYLKRVRAGLIDPKAIPIFKQTTPAVGQLDGRNAFGFIAAHRAMAECIRMAETFGIGMVSVHNSNHFGMAASFVLQACEANMLSLVFTNSSPALPPWGGRNMLLGTSPIACGAPGGSHGEPFCLDMAPSIAARGKIYKAQRRGESIPDDWALDKHGNRTTDPSAALDGGVLLPVGGPKGSALAIMMDVFSGVFSGSAFAGDVIGPYQLDGKANVGHFFVAIKRDLFMSTEDFKARMDTLYQRVVDCERMQGTDRIYFPGEIETLKSIDRKMNGIPYATTEIEALNIEAVNLGIGDLPVGST